ncbi:MAG: phosphoenolpyruvate carboxykinase [Ignavibacteria bacterium RIFCSPLOWO2_02_FULL_55_14]|nr:MAG: phosphoenolpyruvate carboxykinase [Ignavibacteria bacterium RIFCSPLOWO2_02_FULL_55_14]
MSSDIERWVDESARVTTPDRMYWCDGSQREYDALIASMLADKTLIELNQSTHPHCYLHRSDPNDVARTEQLTFVCTQRKEDAGPNNNWISPAEGKEKVRPLFAGSMKGRTMYVIPYLMGPVGSPYSKVGVEITDSPYVAANMHIMSRVGTVALEHYKASKEFIPGLHSLGDISPNRRFIMHFPEERLIWSIGSGYGGNALLGKKCFALRIASFMARQQGWMAEHMLIIGLQDPSGKVTYMAAAFPSASGKTNLAMLVSTLADQGYKVWTIGDDIAWMFIDREGRLRAINPEAGFFGVAPGTGFSTNPIAMETIRKNTIYTNVALTANHEPWWEGIGTEPGSGLIDWQGRTWGPGGTKAAHPNSRFTAPARQCPTISPSWEDPHGVVISAIIFGSRRSVTVPLVYQAFSWQHGVFMGSSMGAETTAAATGAVGVVRRDPMAMLPFCGYNMADYFAHWLEMGKRMKDPPKIFRVNWFRKDASGKFLWPGYGENIRVLKWILDRVEGRGKAVETPLGYMPTADAIETDGLKIPAGAMETLTALDGHGWLNGTVEMEKFYRQFGDRLPKEIWEEHAALRKRLVE